MTIPSHLDDEDREKLVSYLDGELDAAESQAVEARLGRDAKARAEADALKRTWDLLDYLPRPEPSPSFTHRTLDRVSALRPAAAATGRQSRRRPWVTGLKWAAAVLLAWSVGFAGVLAAFYFFQDRADQQLAQDLRVIENYKVYGPVADIALLRDLDHPDLFGDEGPEAGPPLSAGPLPPPADDELEQNRRLLDKWRADPEHYTRLKRDLKEFRALPKREQEGLRKLDLELRREEGDKQARLLRAMDRYVTWLEGLPEDDRQKIRAAFDPGERLRLIKEVREREWTARLPKKQREKVEAAPTPEERREVIARLREGERKFRQEWAQALVPVLRPSDFPDEVQNYVKTLRPLLTAGDKERLRAAEGQGALYANTLVELSDKYAYAVPGLAYQKQMKVQEISAEVRLGALSNKERQELRRLEEKWPDFGLVLMEIARSRRINVPPQPWAPCRPEQFSKPVQQSIEKLGPLLDAKDKKRLDDAEGNWPEYPRVLAELARKKKVPLPGLTVPGSPEFWDKWSAGLPDPGDAQLKGVLPRDRDLTPDEKLGGDPSARERLKEAYFKRNPGELRERLREDYLKLQKKV